MPENFQPSELHVQRFAVPFEYPVVFQRDSLARSDPTLAWAVSRKEPARRHPVLFVVDTGVLDGWPDLVERVKMYVDLHPALRLAGEVLAVPGGERGKNDEDVLRELLRRMAEARLDRQAVVVAIGGGAALDVIGYAASLVHRGVRLVRVPTTVLGQNDSGIGVKTGVNRFEAKNFLGTFAPPFAVINDSRWFETLPLREVRAGLAEAVKVALIKDAAFFEWLEAHASALNRPPAEGRNVVLEEAIRRCAVLHLEHIRGAGDPFELGSARPLDYGHWAAHRLELMSGHELRHGEAVGLGMLLDARYAQRAGLLPEGDVERIVSLVRGLGLPISHPALLERSGSELSVLRGLDDFREHLGGALSVTLLTGIGQHVEVSEMERTRIQEAVEWLAAGAESQTQPV